MIGAYSETLKLMGDVGVNPGATLLRLPLELKFPNGAGLTLPAWPAPFDALAGILSAKGWSLKDKTSLVVASLGWRRRHFICNPDDSVAQLCRDVSPRVMRELIDPLCVSALNTPSANASGQVFLTVLRDSLFGGPGSSNLLLPKTDLSQLFPMQAAEWVTKRGGHIRLGRRVPGISCGPGQRWLVADEAFDALILATSPSNVPEVPVNHTMYATTHIANDVLTWRQMAGSLKFEAITTVYAWGDGARLKRPMLALQCDGGADTHPAQFVFDRAQLGGPPGLLAFVVSASHGERDALQSQVLRQANEQLGLTLQAVQTVVEKRATFSCTPNLKRPPMQIAPGLLACGDYVEGPYPATLEGAVRSGLAAASML